MKKKTLIMSLCSLMSIASVAVGSIAYLTSTATVKNQFTVGSIDLQVNETLVNSQGNPVDENGNVVDPANPNSGEPARTGEGNQYHLIPGGHYVKDPTVTIGKDSDSCYVRLLVTISKASELNTLCQALHAADPEKYSFGLLQDHVSGYEAETWVYAAQTLDEQANMVTYEFRYFDRTNNTDIVSADGTNDLVLDPLFDSITVPDEVTAAQMESIQGFEIDVVGQAIQTAGFQSADEAWASFPMADSAADENDGEDNTQQDEVEPVV